MEVPLIPPPAKGTPSRGNDHAFVSPYELAKPVARTGWTGFNRFVGKVTLDTWPGRWPFRSGDPGLFSRHFITTQSSSPRSMDISLRGSIRRIAAREGKDSSVESLVLGLEGSSSRMIRITS